MLTLPRSGPYAGKDQQKADRANKFIGRGSTRSSTQRYADALGGQANCGVYAPGDVVFVSAEGARSGRVQPDYAELQRAVDAGVTFVTDALGNGENGTRSSAYNLGEREVAAFLSAQGYRDSSSGTWTRAG